MKLKANGPNEAEFNKKLRRCCGNSDTFALKLLLVIRRRQKWLSDSVNTKEDTIAAYQFVCKKLKLRGDKKLEIPLMIFFLFVAGLFVVVRGTRFKRL